MEANRAAGERSLGPCMTWWSAETHLPALNSLLTVELAPQGKPSILFGRLCSGEYLVYSAMSRSTLEMKA